MSAGPTLNADDARPMGARPNPRPAPPFCPQRPQLRSGNSDSSCRLIAARGEPSQTQAHFDDCARPMPSRLHFDACRPADIGEPPGPKQTAVIRLLPFPVGPRRPRRYSSQDSSPAGLRSRIERYRRQTSSRSVTAIAESTPLPERAFWLELLVRASRKPASPDCRYGFLSRMGSRGSITQLPPERLDWALMLSESVE